MAAVGRRGEGAYHGGDISFSGPHCIQGFA